MNISAFGVTHIGCSSSRENQDTFFIGDGVYGVFDGHGTHGLAAATAARDCLSSPTATFAEAEAAVLSTKGGTTASVVRIDKDTGAIEVNHVGDTEVRYYDLGQSEGQFEGQSQSGVNLTLDHSALSKDEFLRIREREGPKGSFVFARSYRYMPERFVFVEDAAADRGWRVDDAYGNFYSTVRKDWATYVSNELGDKLAVTRALGDDHMKPCGVIAEPSVVTASGAESPRAVVIASDGVWDVMQYEEVGEIVRRTDLVGNAEAAAHAVLGATLEKQRELLGATGGDNATVIIVYVAKAK